jgi:phenylacetate-coenzyme A ligase PaaK-like adenylate-forming protein
LNTFKSFESHLYDVNGQSFEEKALALFRFQATYNQIYREFIRNLSVDINNILSIERIPFLPISLFKKHEIKSGNWKPVMEFQSSGTTGITTSKHLIPDLQFYQNHAERCFNHFFGDVADYHFLAFLPSYVERKNSSLIAMIDWFIKKSQSPVSGYYLNNVERLLSDLESLRGDKKKVILWGVSFALLDLVERYQPDLSHCVVFETGGMKGRRKEITREELHSILKKGFNINSVYSEYGMTELLSQAYSLGEAFSCPPWMKVMTRELSDPLQIIEGEETGGINIIDLANAHSVAFIETEDLGKVYKNGFFEVLGRIDNSDVRGCNLLIE